MAGITTFEAVKIQARVMIPIVRALEAELGKEKAHGLVGRALAEAHANFVATRVASRDAHPSAEIGAFSYPVESAIVENTETSLAVDMTACEFAKYFRSIGEPGVHAHPDPDAGRAVLRLPLAAAREARPAAPEPALDGGDRAQEWS